MDSIFVGYLQPKDFLNKSKKNRSYLLGPVMSGISVEHYRFYRDAIFLMNMYTLSAPEVKVVKYLTNFSECSSLLIGVSCSVPHGLSYQWNITFFAKPVLILIT